MKINNVLKTMEDTRLENSCTLGKKCCGHDPEFLLSGQIGKAILCYAVEVA